MIPYADTSSHTLDHLLWKHKTLFACSLACATYNQAWSVIERGTTTIHISESEHVAWSCLLISHTNVRFQLVFLPQGRLDGIGKVESQMSYLHETTS